LWTCGFGSFKRVTTFATLMIRFASCPRRLKALRYELIPRNDDFVPTRSQHSLGVRAARGARHGARGFVP
jgi:hypothetical protein